MDLDGDGNKDLLSGSYSRMSEPMAGLFQVLWGQADGSFKKAAVLKGTDGEPLIIPADEDAIIEKICTRPMAVDWNADGKLDLVVGNFAGSFYLFAGEGRGKFSPVPKKIMTDAGPLKIEGHHSDPFPIDWDGDGDLDLLSGSSNGGVQWAENRAGAGVEPALSPFRELIKTDGPIDYEKLISERELTGPTGSTRVWVDDVNGDGKFDVLVGDSVTLTEIAKGVTKEDFERKKAQWEKDVAKAREEYEAAEGNEEKVTKAVEKIQKLYAERSQFIVEDSTGFVWLYLQK